MIGPRSALYVVDLVRFRQMAAGYVEPLLLNLPLAHIYSIGYLARSSSTR